jgi:hypothetical protein
MIAIFAESPLSPERPMQTAWRGSTRPDGWTKGDGSGRGGATSLQPFELRGIVVMGEVEVTTRGWTALREISIEDDTNRGEAFARPEDIKGVIPGAVEVAD